MTNARDDFSLDSELDQTVGWDEDEAGLADGSDGTDEWESGYDDEDPELTTG